MDRRSFLKASALGGGAAAVSSLAAPAIAGGHARTLTMVTSWPRGFAVLDDAATYFNEAVNAMSGGELIIEKKAPGELVGAFEVFDAVTSGQADMYHSADYYFLGQHPGYAFYTAVPFGATAQELTNWYYHDGGQDLHDELGSIFGLKSFLCGNSGSQSGGWFRKEIKSAQDLAGLRFRMPGLGGQVLGKLGVSVQNIPGGELYQALSSGALDGLEWVGPFADERAGFQEVAKIYLHSRLPRARFRSCLRHELGCLERFVRSAQSHYRQCNKSDNALSAVADIGQQRRRLGASAGSRRANAAIL